jgi:DNA-directed RNA polymerase specialized sigma24 family protein
VKGRAGVEGSARALNDEDIVAALRQRSDVGVEQLLATYHAPLLACAFRLLADRHAAEDVVQESLLRFLNYLDDLRDPARLRAQGACSRTC